MCFKYVNLIDFFTFLPLFFQIPSFDANPLPSQGPLQPLQQDQPIKTSQVLIYIQDITLNALQLNTAVL